MTEPMPNATVTRAAGSGLGRVEALGHIDYGPGEAGLSGLSGPRVFGRHALVLLLAGAGFYEDTRGRRRAVAAGDLIWVFPDLGQWYGPVGGGGGAGEGWSEVYLVFEGPLFVLWEDAGLLDRARPVWRVGRPEAWRARVEAVPEGPLPRLAPGDGREPERALREVARLQALLADLLPFAPPAAAGVGTGGGSGASSAWAADACDALRRLGDARAAAAAMHLSYARFRRRLVAEVGLPPARFLAIARIEEACRLLQDRRLTLADIADRLGFSDRFHFSRRFRDVMGQPPGAYRDSLP